MVKYREILRLHAAGISMRDIAFSCGCSKTTVKNVVDKARARGLEWPLPEEMGDAAMKSALFPAKPKGDADKAEIVNGNVFYRRCGKEPFPSAVSRISPGPVTSFSLDAVRTSSHSSERRFSV